ncbi:hypothetical protein F5146DRAFT_1029054 [Armillaria mellea]|nr:hypothetical protein F5146DRAFT_1029054 [Armillaria mellea]
MAWRRSIPVVPSHARPVHPLDSECRLLAILNDTPYIPPDVPDDVPTLDPAEYKRWMRDTLLGKQHPCHEPEDWGDSLRRKREDEDQHHRASRDEPNNNIYNNMSSVGPSESTMTMPNQSYPQPQPPPWHGMHSTSQVSPLVLPVGPFSP